MTKIIEQGADAPNHLLEGVQELARIVGSTIGSKGQNVVMIDKIGNPVITNDGVTIANDIHFKDPFMELGADIVRQAANKTNSVAGDGTTTTTILASVISEYYIKRLGDVNGVDLKKEIDELSDSACSLIKKMSTSVRSNSKIREIATISSQDKNIGVVIADIFKELGDQAKVIVEKGGDKPISSSIIKGLQFETGIIDPVFLNKDTNRLELQNSEFMIIQGKVEKPDEIFDFVKELSKEENQKSLVIFAEDFSQDFIKVCAINHANKVFSIIPIRFPLYGYARQELINQVEKMIDCGSNTYPMAKITSGKIQKLIIDQNKTTFIHDNPEMENSPGLGVINVNLSTDIQTTEKILRIEDAINATKAAIRGGVLPGGGVALRDTGLFPLSAPYMKILENAGIEHKDDLPLGVGINTDTGEQCNMIKEGVIDPTIVVLEAIKNACSIAGVLVTTYAAIVNEEKAK